MSIFNNNLDDNEIADIKREKEEEQERFIQDQIDKGIIPDYQQHQQQQQTKHNIGNGNGNGKSQHINNKKQQLNPALKKLQTNNNNNNNNNNTKNNLSSGNEVEILNTIEKLRRENPDLTFEQWSNILLKKRIKFNDKVSEYFPDMQLLSD
jgi:hypothetical protein